jgi:hypothetical protein
VVRILNSPLGMSEPSQSRSASLILPTKVNL